MNLESCSHELIIEDWEQYIKNRFIEKVKIGDRTYLVSFCPVSDLAMGLFLASSNKMEIALSFSADFPFIWPHLRVQTFDVDNSHGTHILLDDLKKKESKNLRVLISLTIFPLGSEAMFLRNLKLYQLALKGEKDIKIVCKGDVVYYAHRDVLISQSEYFSKLLDSNLLESKEGEIAIENSPSAIDSLLTFLYTGYVPYSTTNSILYEAIDLGTRYLLEEFINFNVEFLCNQIFTKQDAGEAYFFVHPNEKITKKINEAGKKWIANH